MIYRGDEECKFFGDGLFYTLRERDRERVRGFIMFGLEVACLKWLDDMWRGKGC